MTNNNSIDHEKERAKDSDKILKSSHPRKVVLAGPGTVKSFLFKEAIKRKKAQGGHDFLAITFIGNLTDELADDLAGLAETTTLHGFARGFALRNCPAGWEYYPRMREVIDEDLAVKGITEIAVGDSDYEERTKYYRAFGDNDVIHYSVQICKTDTSKIPVYDLILIDEFQDFNETEAELIDLLATKNEVLVVGDDDQALYEFKGSLSRFIRDKFNSSDDEFESHTLRYCSRCTEVIINSFHSIVDDFSDRERLSERISKEYEFYPPDKEVDSKLNPKVLLVENLAPGATPAKIRFELSAILKEQKIKSVLVLGEGRTCRTQLASIARILTECGFKDVRLVGRQKDLFTFKQQTVSGYKVLAKRSNDILGWRLLIDGLGDNGLKNDLILNHYSDAEGFVKNIPKEFKKTAEKNCSTLHKILNKSESERAKIADSSIERLAGKIVEDEKEKRSIFVNQLIDENVHLPRPLANLSITVCNILGAKGLSADVVFLIGFDQGKLPMGRDAEDSEIYQFLVALTRARKRIYLINTMGRHVSQFLDSIDKNCIEKL